MKLLKIDKKHPDASRKPEFVQIMRICTNLRGCVRIPAHVRELPGVCENSRRAILALFRDLRMPHDAAVDLAFLDSRRYVVPTHPELLPVRG